MNTISKAFSLLAISFLLVGCKIRESTTAQNLEIDTSLLQTAPSTASTSTKTVLNDTAGLSAFLDSLKSDLLLGRMTFFISHMNVPFDGGEKFQCDSFECRLRTDIGFSKSTARLLTWNFQWAKMVIDTTIFEKSPQWEVFGPFPGRNEIVFGQRPSRDESDDDSGNSSANKFPVFVGTPKQPFYASIGGDSIGVLGVDSVRRLEERGGLVPNGFHSGKIQMEWMQVETPDARRGWTKGASLRDWEGPFAILRIEHLTTGWRIAGLFSSEEER
jgi:hypothetical protein